MGSPGCGDSLVALQEVMEMWYKPVCITLELKKTRTGWQVTIRVRFNA
jgi:hypothetical protein